MKYETKEMLELIIPLILFIALLMGLLISLDQYQIKFKLF